MVEKYTEESEHITQLMNSFSIKNPSTFKHFAKLMTIYCKYYICYWVSFLTVIRFLHILGSHIVKSSHCTYSFMDPGYLARNALLEGNYEKFKKYIKICINPNFRDIRTMTLFEYLAKKADEDRKSEKIQEKYVELGVLLLKKGASFNDAYEPLMLENVLKGKKFFRTFDWIAIVPKIMNKIGEYFFSPANNEIYFDDNRDLSKRLNDLHGECLKRLKN